MQMPRSQGQQITKITTCSSIPCHGVYDHVCQNTLQQTAQLPGMLLSTLHPCTYALLGIQDDPLLMYRVLSGMRCYDT